MSAAQHFALIETDFWPALRPKIEEERRNRMDGLLTVATTDALRHEQGFIAGLDWVLDAAKPKPRTKEGDYDE